MQAPGEGLAFRAAAQPSTKEERISMALVVSSTTDTQAEVDAAAGLEPAEQQQPETAQQPEPKQPPPAPRPVPVPSPDEDEEDPGEEPAQEEEPKPKRTGGFQRKIEKLTRGNEYLARRVQELDYALRHNGPAQPPQQPAPAQADARPQQDQFGSYEEYIEGLTDWKLGQAMQKREEQERQQAAARVQQQQVSSWHENVGKFKSDAPDFDEVLEGVDHIEVPPVMQQALMRDPSGPKLAYELARQPEKFAEIARLDPLAQSIALGEFKASLNGAAQAAAPRPKATVSQAPAPIRPVGQGASTSTVPYDQLPYQDYKRRREAEIKARRHK